MEAIIPENISEITLGQYMTYMDSMHDNATDEEVLDITFKSFTNVKDTTDIPVKDKIEVLELITKAFQTEGKSKQTITLNGVKYGLIPNFDKVATGEYVDLCKYGVLDELDYSLLKLDYKTLHRFVCICYRPIVKEHLDSYTIEPYENTNNADVFKDLPLSYVIGLEGFFLTLHNDLKTALTTYTEGEHPTKGNNRTWKSTASLLLFLGLATMTILLLKSC